MDTMFTPEEARLFLASQRQMTANEYALLAILQEVEGRVFHMSLAGRGEPELPKAGEPNWQRIAERYAVLLLDRGRRLTEIRALIDAGMPNYPYGVSKLNEMRELTVYPNAT